MDSNEIIFFFKKNYLLFNYMTTKIDDCQIKHQPNIKMHVEKNNNNSLS